MILEKVDWYRDMADFGKSLIKKYIVNLENSWFFWGEIANLGNSWFGKYLIWNKYIGKYLILDEMPCV